METHWLVCSRVFAASWATLWLCSPQIWQFVCVRFAWANLKLWIWTVTSADTVCFLFFGVFSFFFLQIRRNNTGFLVTMNAFLQTGCIFACKKNCTNEIFSGLPVKKRPFNFPVEEGFSELSHCGQTHQPITIAVWNRRHIFRHRHHYETSSLSVPFWQTRRKLTVLPTSSSTGGGTVFTPLKLPLLYDYFVEWGVPKISSSSKGTVKTWALLFFRVSVTNLCRGRCRRVLIRVFLIWGFCIFAEFNS